MKLSWQAFSVHKLGSTQDENEDAIWPQLDAGTYASRRRFQCSISDGATQSSFSSLWAKLLVRYGSRTSQKNIKKAVDHAQRDWNNKIAELGDIPWHTEIKIRQGASASLVLLRLYKSLTRPDGYWKVIAVGDSCLFHFRGDELVKSFPIENPDEFGFHPTLFSSKPQNNNQIWENFDQYLDRGRWKYRDRFILATDAMARWILWSYLEKQKPISIMEKIFAGRSFAQIRFTPWIEKLRRDNLIKNDDTSLIWLKISER